MYLFFWMVFYCFKFLNYTVSFPYTSLLMDFIKHYGVCTCCLEDELILLWLFSLFAQQLELFALFLMEFITFLDFRSVFVCVFDYFLWTLVVCIWCLEYIFYRLRYCEGFNFKTYFIWSSHLWFLETWHAHQCCQRLKAPSL